MTPFQHALLKLAEECTEVAQSAAKNMQFGYDSVCPKTGLTNKEQLHMELNDIMGCILHLNEDFHLNYDLDENAAEEKVKKIKHYREYSIQVGFVTN